MTKYQYNNPVMQQVAKLCDDGHYPIYLLEDGEYAIFTPFRRNTDGVIRRSYTEDTIEECKNSISKTFHDNSDPQPVKRVDFYHPPFTAYKVDEKVRVRKDLEFLQCDDDWERCGQEYQNTAGKVGIIINNDSVGYTVHFDHINDWFSYAHHQLEPCIENQETLELTIDEIAQKFGVDSKNIKIKK
jgi:hypothetical protein